MTNEPSPDDFAAQVFGSQTPLPPFGNIEKGELAIKFSNSTFWLPLDEPTMRRVHRQTGVLSDELRNSLELNQQKASEFLSKSLQLPNLALFAGSGASLGEPNGPSMWDLWVKCMFVNAEDNGIENAVEQLHEEAKAICNKLRYTDLESPNIEHFLFSALNHLLQ